MKNFYIHIDKPWNFNIFADKPKCRNDWRRENGAGCLLTAFWEAWGITFESYPSLGLCKETDYLAETFDIASSFVDDVMVMFDEGDEQEAFNLVWSLIEKLPNKINCPSLKPSMGSCKIEA